MKLLKCTLIALSLSSLCFGQSADVDTTNTHGERVDTPTERTAWLTALGVPNIENVALSTWAGSGNITNLGTINTGTWQGTAIADAYISSAAAWNAKQSAITFGTGVQTALGVNIGSAGAPVLFDGALGTPSSGSGANLTSLNGSNISSGTVAADRLGSSGGAGKFLRYDNTWQTIGGGGDLLAANNLSDLANAATARTNLGLGTAATTAATDYTPAVQVKSASFTAANDTFFVVTATATATDPTPTEGKGYEVYVRNGTATVGGTAYALAGTRIVRIYHSGAWANTVYHANGNIPVSGLAQSSATTGQILRWNGSSWIPYSPWVTMTEQASTSGTQIDFTSIPDGVSEIVVFFNECSFDGGSHFRVQIGGDSTPETTGYIGSSTLSAGVTTGGTNGIVLAHGTAALTYTGVLTLKNLNGEWVATSNGRNSTPVTSMGAAAVTVTGSDVNILRIAGTAGNNFDAGAIRVAYRY